MARIDIPKQASITIRLEKIKTSLNEDTLIFLKERKKNTWSINISMRRSTIITWCQFFIILKLTKKTPNTKSKIALSGQG